MCVFVCVMALALGVALFARRITQIAVRKDPKIQAKFMTPVLLRDSPVLLKP